MGMMQEQVAVRVPKILVVEDEAIVAMDLEEQLREMGYDVCATTDCGQDALALIEQHRPNLVLMDIVIKGDMDGIETARHIGRGLQTPVVFLTSHSDSSTVSRAILAAPYGYVTKPFQSKDLRAAIEVALCKAQLETRLRESEQWFASTLRCVGDGVVATDANNRIRFMNPQAEEAIGWQIQEVAGQDVNEVFVLRDQHSGTRIESPVLRALREDKVVSIAFGSILAGRNGTQLSVDDSAAPIRSENGEVLGAVMVFRDVSNRLLAEQALRRSEERFRNAFEFAPAGMALVALDGRFLQVNKAVCRLLGFDESHLLCRTEWEFTHPADIAMERAELARLIDGSMPVVQFEKRYRGPTGNEIWILASISMLREGKEPICYLYQTHDLSDRKSAESQLQRLAHFDQLTGLSNRTRMYIDAERMIQEARRNNQRLGVVFLDLDHFKRVNDSFGHDAGDRLLQITSQRLQDCMRETDCVARLGGDEFVVLLGGLNRSEDAGVVTETIRRTFVEPFVFDGHEVPTTASLGVSIYPDDADELRSLFRCADSALYHAKAEGRNNTQFYRPELTAKVEARLKVESALHRALERGEFVLHYQPLVNLSDARPVGAEALLRWNQPEHGVVSPDTFIPVAEESGLIVELGEWVIQQACHQAAGWRDMGFPLTASVNVAARQFKQGDLVAVVQSALKSAKLDPSLLCLEITEQHVLHDTEHNLAVIERLKALGVNIALDDFGIGYSSLSYLKRFAPQSLKIDRSFVRDVAHDSDDAAIVSAVIAMAKRLKIQVVAEGVETEAQRAFLLEEHCELAQGYLFSRPLPAPEFRAWLAHALG